MAAKSLIVPIEESQELFHLWVQGNWIKASIPVSRIAITIAIKSRITITTVIVFVVMLRHLAEKLTHF